MKNTKISLRDLKEEATSKEFSLDDLLKEWFETKSTNDPAVTLEDRYYQGASSFRAFLQEKLRR
ncbi:MAG: hypothetical protein ABR880_21825 [Candidatus Sulfotelmatobacter sp.]|jgi:hypothetical protein